MAEHESKAVLVVFNGIKFRRYPQARSAAHRHYFWPSGNHRKRGVGALHVEIWKAHHGPIPDGFEIHHKDGDHLNNDIDNLELIEAGEHRRLHLRSERQLARLRVHIENIRPLASLWHASLEGREWHRQQARFLKQACPPVKHRCALCGEEFVSTKPTDVRFCSP